MVGPGQLLNNWNPTWWGNKQLTHLPGVRETLKKHHAAERNNEYYMNLLATFGPHDVKSAWQYFKYWVKGEKSVTRPDFVTGNEEYDNMLNTIPTQRSGPRWMAEDTGPRGGGGGGRGSRNFGSGTTGAPLPALQTFSLFFVQFFWRFTPTLA